LEQQAIVLEGSPTSSVLGYTELYKGEKTEFSVFPVFSGFSSAKYFRVKGENKVLSVESPWSNVVTDPEDPPVTGISHLGALLSHGLSAPVLEVEAPVLEVESALKTFESKKLRWTSVLGAHSYVLESSGTESFLQSREEYRGANTHYFVFSFRRDYTSLLELATYRVRAIGISPNDASPWSNVVQLSRK
jgi:hypothetical protein